jgi:putative transcriptional regulator
VSGNLIEEGNLLYGDGLGKKRSKFGRFLDENAISQQVIAEYSGVSKSTISRLCLPEEFEPTMKIARKIVKVLKDAGYDVDYKDFWDL